MSTTETVPARHGRLQARAAYDRPGLGGMLTWTVRRIENAFERRRQRRDLMALTDDQLKDIGISRSMANREASRPFWE